jgi:hypothetical protein
MDDDENEIVEWDSENEYDLKKYFDCGCCDECLCDDNIKCKNCGCNCNGDEFEDDFSYYDNDELDSIAENTNNVDINIIKDVNNKKIIRITLQLDMLPTNIKDKIINIDLDINNNTLQLFEELFNN